MIESMLSFAADGDKGDGRSHSGDQGHAGAEAPQLVKAAAATWDSASDSQKAIVDAAHAAAALQKVALSTEETHTVQPIAETQADINGAFILMQQQQQQQKIAAAAQPVESFTVHIDSSLAFFQAIAVQDVTLEAQQFLNIHLSGNGDPSKSPAGIDNGQAPPSVVSANQSGDGGGDHLTTGPALGNTTGSAPSTVGSAGSTSQTPTPFTGSDIYVTADNGAIVIQAISDFANNANHLVNPNSISISAGLTAELQHYFGSETSLKLVFFESTVDAPDILLAAPGVVFVNEKEVSPLAHLVNPGGSLTIHEPNSVFVTLVGVATIEHGVSV